MSRRRLFWRLLLQAAWVRKDRALTALISVTVAAAIATAAGTVYSSLESKLSREFRGFGANVIVSSRQGSLAPAVLAKLRQQAGRKAQVVPVAYAIAKAADGSRVVVAGTDIGGFRGLNSWWSVRDAGHPNSKVLLGSRAARVLSPKGNAFTVAFGARQATLKPEIIFDSGSDDDSRVYIDLKEFAALTGREPGTALMRMEGRPKEMERATATLRTAFPDLEIHPVRQITQAQAAVVGRTRSLVLAASIVVLVLILMCMMATLTSSVFERRKDFAVMKALGASSRAVSMLFAFESSLLALAGAILGYVAGSAIAYWIGKADFGAAILPEPMLLPPVLAGSVLLALLAATTPLGRLQQIQPASILRGE